MPIRIVRLGSPRVAGEGLRLGTVRRPPRGVKKTDYSTRDFFDTWLPELAPTSRLVSSALAEPLTLKRWTAFARRYLKEMREPRARHLIDLLAAMSHHTSFSIGCYCEDQTRCHRSLLRDLLVEADADLVPQDLPGDLRSA